MPGHTERDFEHAIERGLIDAGGFKKGSPGRFRRDDRDLFR